MEKRDTPYRCGFCNTEGLPAVSEFDGQPIPSLPRIIACKTCGTEYRLRKTLLAAAQIRSDFWGQWVTPNWGLIIITLGFGLLLMYLMYLATRLLGALITLPIYKRIS